MARSAFSRQAIRNLINQPATNAINLFVHQMKLLHPVNDRKNVGFSKTEILEAKLAIDNNVVASMVQVRIYSLLSDDT